MVCCNGKIEDLDDRDREILEEARKQVEIEIWRTSRENKGGYRKSKNRNRGTVVFREAKD